MTIASSSLGGFLFKCFNEDGRSSRFLVLIGCLFVLLNVSLVEASPYRSKNKGRDGPQLVYDQKQTGDYNIQVHLKDFQIIALLGDDVLGDYDYNYDYADFTIKPSGSTSTTSTTPNISTTTELPSSSSPSSTTTTKPIDTFIVEDVNGNSNTKPSTTNTISNIHPYPIEIVVLDPTKKPIEEPSNTNDNKQSLPNDVPSSTVSPNTTTAESITPGKIKVQILEVPAPTETVASVPVGIVPGEDVQADDGGVLQGEFASYRKCASGFARDKRGRCRRIRRPGVASQLPYGFGRLASNLATRLRLPSSNEKGVGGTPSTV